MVGDLKELQALKEFQAFKDIFSQGRQVAQSSYLIGIILKANEQSDALIR